MDRLGLATPAYVFPRELRFATILARPPALCSHSARALLGLYPCSACVLIAWCSHVARGLKLIWLSSEVGRHILAWPDPLGGWVGCCSQVCDAASFSVSAYCLRCWSLCFELSLKGCAATEWSQDRICPTRPHIASWERSWCDAAPASQLYRCAEYDVHVSGFLICWEAQSHRI